MAIRKVFNIAFQQKTTKFLESGDFRVSTGLTSVVSLHPKTQMHQCRTQLVSNNNWTKQSLVTTSFFKLGVDSNESERISFNRLDKNTMIF